MEEQLVHFICRLPKIEDCIDVSTYTVIAKESFKNSTIENVLLGKTFKIEQSAFENCKELGFVAWGKDKALNNNSQVLFTLNENYIKGFAGVEVTSEDKLNKSYDDKGEVNNKPSILIQNSAFKGCDKLETIIFPTNKCIIEKDAFAHCKSLRTVVLLGGDTEIYDDPFIGCKDLTIICKKDDYKLCAFARTHSFRVIEI